MNYKPDKMKKDSTLNIFLSEKEKDYITKKALAQKCSRSTLIINCVHAAGERRTIRERNQIKNKVVKQNIINIMKRNECSSDKSMRALFQLEKWEVGS